jgi:hypothetical protein
MDKPINHLTGKPMEPEQIRKPQWMREVEMMTDFVLGEPDDDKTRIVRAPIVGSVNDTQEG